MNYPLRQQRRRVARGARLGLAGAAAGVLGGFVVTSGAVTPGALLLAVAILLGLRARHWLSLAARSGVGARSEREVQMVLDPLRREGWRVRRSVSWPGRGDIDSAVVAPSGLGFAIETKTRSYDERHLRRVREQAVWLARRRWTRGALAVLCIVRASGVERCESGVLVVSIDRLVGALWSAAEGMSSAAA